MSSDSEDDSLSARPARAPDAGGDVDMDGGQSDWLRGTSLRARISVRVAQAARICVCLAMLALPLT